MAPPPSIFPALSRAFKSKRYLPTGCGANSRKRKRSPDDGAPFEVGPSSNGVGMFAARDISCGDIIEGNEDPIVHCCLATEGSRANVCSACAAPIGSLREDHLGAPEDISLPYFGDDDARGLVFTTSEIRCPSCREAVWCSKECHGRHRAQHSVLCGHSAALDAFCGAQGNPLIFKLAVQSILLVTSHAASLSETERNPIEQFYWWNDYGAHPLWWEVGKPSKDANAKKERAVELGRILAKALLEAIRRRKLTLGDDWVNRLCAPEIIGSILGMLQCNVMQYEYPSPRQQYMAQAEEVLDQFHGDGDSDGDGDDAGKREEEIEMSRLKDGCRWLIDNVGNEQSQQSCSGSGLYPLLTLANHHCNPNASIEFLQESNRGTMIAARDIPAGEEICITYVPNGGAGNGDSPEYFRHFEPTRTWKWLNSNDDGDECSDEESSEGDGDDLECPDEEDGGDLSDHDCDNEEGRALEGSEWKYRADALLEYGFDCRCERCLEERRGG